MLYYINSFNFVFKKIYLGPNISLNSTFKIEGNRKSIIMKMYPSGFNLGLTIVKFSRINKVTSKHSKVVFCL